MTDELRNRMERLPLKLLIAHEGVGTIEFLVDKHRDFFSWK
jgi:acetyl/propionyl-CoA carboxylase alpha subunit